MGWQYNESLVEGLAVLSNYTTTSVTANMTAGMACTPFFAGNLKRVLFDITVLAAANTTSTCQVALQGATTAGATFYTITGPDTTFPSLVTTSFTAGGTVTTTITTVVNVVRFDFKAESIRNAIDYYNSTTTAGGTKAGPWIRLALNPLGGVSGTGTFALNMIAYGVAGYSPAADVNVTKFISTTSVLCPYTNAYIDGWPLSNTTAFKTQILPY